MTAIKLVTFFIVTNFISANLLSQINHVEPLSWFVGMKSPRLQLLINGNNIGETTPQINYPGVSIKKVNKADSKHYLFIDLLIAKTAKPGPCAAGGLSQYLFQSASNFHKASAENNQHAG